MFEAAHRFGRDGDMFEAAHRFGRDDLGGPRSGWTTGRVERAERRKTRHSEWGRRPSRGIHEDRFGTKN